MPAWVRSPTPGCLVLGAAGSVDTVDVEQQEKCRPIYVTRHRIDSYRQSKPLCRHVASDMFLPCAGHDENRPVMWAWHVLRSELMLFVLHMSTLVFGVIKESLDLRHLVGHFHLIHTVVETLVTLLIIFLRVVNARMGYVEVQVIVQRLQHFDPVHEPHLRAVWTWMWLLLVAGAVTFVVCVICLVVFDQLAHLGWTVLSNQACIIVMKLLGGFYHSRVHAAVDKIKGDQLTLIIHEALMLLQETTTAEAVSDDDVKQVPVCATSNASARRFISAAFNTKSLAKPPYIVLTNAAGAQN